MYFSDRKNTTSVVHKPGQSEVFCELFINKDMLAYAEDAEKRLFWKFFYSLLSLHTQYWTHYHVTREKTNL